jgi:hypothetical protein
MQLSLPLWTISTKSRTGSYPSPSQPTSTIGRMRAVGEKSVLTSTQAFSSRRSPTGRQRRARILASRNGVESLRDHTKGHVYVNNPATMTAAMVASATRTRHNGLADASEYQYFSNQFGSGCSGIIIALLWEISESDTYPKMRRVSCERLHIVLIFVWQTWLTVTADA